MTISEIIVDLIFAPYRIGKLQKSKKSLMYFCIIQIPYLLVPGIFLMFVALFYVMIIRSITGIVSFVDLLINSKKYKYSDGQEYSEEYLNIDYPLLEV